MLHKDYEISISFLYLQSLKYLSNTCPYIHIDSCVSDFSSRGLFLFSQQDYD